MMSLVITDDTAGDIVKHPVVSEIFKTNTYAEESEHIRTCIDAALAVQGVTVGDGLKIHHAVSYDDIVVVEFEHGPYTVCLDVVVKTVDHRGVMGVGGVLAELDQGNIE